MSGLPVKAPSWAWPLHPFGNNSAMGCHDATAQRPYPLDGNIRLSTDVALTSTARLEVGRPFGVLMCQANSNQKKLGVGRLYYLPTAEDVLRVQQHFPDLPEPQNPNWLAIGNKLRGDGHAHLAKLTPPELLKLLDANETPPVAEPAPPNAAPPSTTAPPTGVRGESHSRKGKRINERMAAMLQADPTLIQWTAEQWALKLSCHASTVKGTATWTNTIKAARCIEMTGNMPRPTRKQRNKRTT